MFDLVSGTPDSTSVLGSYQQLNDAVCILRTARVEDWRGPGSERAELRRGELMGRAGILLEQLGELHSLTLGLEELDLLIAAGSAA